MAEEDYIKKLEHLQLYIPFLENMITQLKDPNRKNREQQLSKMESLHAMITDRKKKLKIETLNKCEDVISKLYLKVNHKPLSLITNKTPDMQMLCDSPSSTPASPSPTRESFSLKPLTIPTERIVTESCLPKIDIYSSAAESLQRPKIHEEIRLGGHLPDMSKPPISLEDLKTLEEDVQEKINENASLSELNNIRNKIAHQLIIENIKSVGISTSPSPDIPINTTVRNNLNLMKITHPLDKSKRDDAWQDAAKNPDKPVDEKISHKLNTISIQFKPKSTKILKEPASIFGSILSNIDDQLLEGHKKKDDRRNSLTGKEEKQSKSSDRSKEKKYALTKDDKKDKEEKSKFSSDKEKSKHKDNKLSKDSPESSDKNKKTEQHEKKEPLEINDKDPSEKKTNFANSSKDVDQTSSECASVSALSKIIVKKIEDLKEQSNDTNPQNKPFKRLADKYNPKPKKSTVDIDVDKVVADSIEANMKISPPKLPLINQMAAPIPPPASLLACTQLDSDQPQTPPLSTVLQNLMNSNKIVTQIRPTKTEPDIISPLIQPMQNSLMSPTDSFVSDYVRDDYNPRPRLQFEPPQHHQQFQRSPNQFQPNPNQFGPGANPNRPLIPPLLGDSFRNSPRPLFPPNERFNQPFNADHCQPIDYYPPSAPTPSNQFVGGPPLLSPEIPFYHNEPKPNNFNMMPNRDMYPYNDDMRWRMDDRNQWERNREFEPMYRGPTTYREYREMKEGNRPPRIPRDPRDNRDTRENNRDHRDNRDPRLNREAFRNVEAKDPRLNRFRERAQSSDSRPSKYDSKFDQVYSRTNRDSSRSGSRDPETKDSFLSPLDGIYSGKERKVGKGYGVQNFRIPKKKKDEITAEVDKDDEKVTSSTENDSNIDQSANETAEDDNCDSNMSDTKEDTETVNEKQDEKTDILKDTAEVIAENPPNEIEVEAKVEPVVVKEPNPESSKGPTEQTILAQFFANLLGSQNKKEKKTALYSLISTFSDSFSPKELSKITKIIKAEDGAKSSDEEETSTSTKPEPNTTSHSETSDDTQSKDKSSADTEIEDIKIPKSKRRVRRISSASPPRDDPIDDTVPPKDNTEARDSDGAEDVIVTVGERIKSRKRKTTASSKPKKRCRTELDMLHEDIQDMFIRDGVLTATGKRMCRILKDDPNVLITSKPEIVEESKTRRKPGPKSKCRPQHENEMKGMRSMHVLIPKLPESTMEEKEELRRSSRRLTRSMTSIDSDVDSSGQESSGDESGMENSDHGKDHSFQDISQKSKIHKRKRKIWASGVIKKSKRRKAAVVEEPTAEVQETKKAEVEEIKKVEEELPKDKFISPNKEYYVNFRSTDKTFSCKLCDYSGRFITTHYKFIHPNSEVLSSRFSPELFQEAIEDSDRNLAKYEACAISKASTKIDFSCRFCGFSTWSQPTLFFDHISTHTGEYRHICPSCDFSACSGKSLSNHIRNNHKGDEKPIDRKTYALSIIFGFVCGECHYVQLNEKNMEEHVNIFHLQRPVIYKINMSTRFYQELENFGKTVTEANQDKSIDANVAEKELEMLETTEEVVNTETKTVQPSPVKIPKKRGPKPGPRSKKKLQQKVTNQEDINKDKNEEANFLSKLIDESPLLYVRSTRAAKEKAQEKMRVIMELPDNVEGRRPEKLSPKSRTQSISEKNEAVDKLDKPKEKEHADTSAKENTESNSTPVKKDEKSPEKPPVVVKKEIEMNVFTCKTDLQEENQKIHEERLQMMEELNKTVGNRTSLNFVDKLCTRLSNNDIIVKQEPVDESTAYVAPLAHDNSKSPLTMPVLEKISSTIARTEPVPKKPMLEETDSPPVNPNYDVTQKNDKVITDMIEKLKWALGPANDNIDAHVIDDNDCDSEGPPPLTHVNELVNEKPFDGSTKTLLVGGLVKVIKTTENIMFCCLVPPCVFSTESQEEFQWHCKTIHAANCLNRTSMLCDICGIDIQATPEITLLENLFQHTIIEHGDFLTQPNQTTPKSTTLRIRKLSGDALSLNKPNDKSEHTEDIQPPTDTDTESNITFDIATTDSTAELISTAELEPNEDNPFPFKIAGVMSLAEPSLEPQTPQLPPLAPIVKPTSPVSPTTQLVVTEAKLTQAELLKPRKTQKAMSKFIDAVGDLYKCPHYYCLFSTNFRDFLERHLKAHKTEQDVMIPCVYCDTKTPWEHVPMHIDVRHGNCRFACSYCLYRAIVKEYVFLHQDLQHSAKDYSVVTLPVPKSTKKYAIAEAKLDPRTLCEPYRCTKICNKEFLYENEFKRHLFEDHNKDTFLTCGFKDCTVRIVASKMSQHWSSIHGICLYQCGYCKTSCNEITIMYQHFAQCHQNSIPEILIRMLTPIQDGVVWGYTAQAFKKMRKIVAVSTNKSFENKIGVTKELSSALMYTVPNSKAKPTVIPSPKLRIISRQPRPSTSTATAVSTVVIPVLPTTSTLKTFPVATYTTGTSNLTTVKLEKIPKSVASNNPPMECLAENVTTLEKDDRNDQLIAPVEEIMLGEDSGQIPMEETADSEIDPLDLGDANKGHSDAFSSDDESDASKPEKPKESTGLLGYQLYRCAFCDFSCSNKEDFRKHATVSEKCKLDFVCVHCSKKMKHAGLLTEHIQSHGIMRYSCSLCDEKFPTSNRARNHMKHRHNVCQTILSHVNNSSILDNDEYVIKPKVVKSAHIKEQNPPESSASSVAADVYMPDELYKIPIRSIFSASVRCGICSYSTKVRTNLVRHLQFHSEEKAVPDMAPVNPVPCLEKNEKMFDKMCNLAGSSHTTGRMGAKQGEGKDKDGDDVPEFVPTSCRYVCCAKGCTYMCPEESNLRHHLIALHDNEVSFTCVHCNADLTSSDADNLLKHFKLHGPQLYKCQNCNFVHNLRHKVEKHMADTHPDGTNKVVTVRNTVETPEPHVQTAPVTTPPATKPNKPWRCCMCKVRTATQDGIRQHVFEKHEMDAQFKCAFCVYKTNDVDTFHDHFKTTHNNQEIDIVDIYRKIEDGPSESSGDQFDTTPLWQRDRPRVRHIRGILFDESSPAPSKLSKKTPKSASSHNTPVAATKSTFANSSPLIISDSSSPYDDTPDKKTVSQDSDAFKTNMEIAIEAVANGTADILKHKGRCISNEPIQQTNKVANSLAETVTKAKELDVIIVEDDDEDTVVPSTSFFQTINDVKPIQISNVQAIIPTEVPGIVQLPLNNISQPNATIAASNDVEDNYCDKKLKKLFGGFGQPLNRQLKCPDCNNFKSKRISDFIFHLYKEKRAYRFKCGVCADESITYRYMYRHVKEHKVNGNCEDKIITLPPNSLLEAWLQLLIQKQSALICKLMNPPQEAVLPETMNSQCYICSKWFSSDSERNEHCLFHWKVVPYGCNHCFFETFQKSHLEKHCENTQCVFSADVQPRSATVVQELKYNDELHMKELGQRLTATPVEAVPVFDKEAVKEVSIASIINAAVEQMPIVATAVGGLGVVAGDAVQLQEVQSQEGSFGMEESDLVIVTKMDNHVLTNDVFCCEYCPHMTEMEERIVDHLNMMHAHKSIKFKKLNRKQCETRKASWVVCQLCDEVGSEISLRKHYLEKHPGQDFSVYRAVCNYCGKKFVKLTSVKIHSRHCHPGLPFRFTQQSNVANETKIYKCSMCPYSREGDTQVLGNLRSHFKCHFKSYVCTECDARFRSKVDGTSHWKREHPFKMPDFIFDLDTDRQFHLKWSELVTGLATDASPMPSSSKSTARKSTSSVQSVSEEEYSFYQVTPEPVDMTKIMTTVDVNGMCLNMSADKLSKIFDLEAYVYVEDCNLSMNMSNVFGS